MKALRLIKYTNSPTLAQTLQVNLQTQNYSHLLDEGGIETIYTRQTEFSAEYTRIAKLIIYSRIYPAISHLIPSLKMEAVKQIKSHTRLSTKEISQSEFTHESLLVQLCNSLLD